MKVSSTEFQQNVGRYQDVAMRESVTITKNGRDHTVLVSAEFFEALTKGRVVRRIEDLDEATIKAIAELPAKYAHDDEVGELAGALTFLREAERLKAVLRSGRTSGGRPESTAEHTWRLSLMALVLAPHLGEMDVTRLLKICIVHDLGEALGGDIPANVQSSKSAKSARERADLQTLATPLAPVQRDEILGLWDEYEAASSREARIAKGLDKLETILQHTQGQSQPDVDYAFNLEYGRKETSAHPVLAAIRRILDEDTRARRAEQQHAKPGRA